MDKNDVDLVIINSKKRALEKISKVIDEAREIIVITLYDQVQTRDPEGAQTVPEPPEPPEPEPVQVQSPAAFSGTCMAETAPVPTATPGQVPAPPPPTPTGARKRTARKRVPWPEGHMRVLLAHMHEKGISLAKGFDEPIEWGELGELFDRTPSAVQVKYRNLLYKVTDGKNGAPNGALIEKAIADEYKYNTREFLEKARKIKEELLARNDTREEDKEPIQQCQLTKPEKDLLL